MRNQRNRRRFTALAMTTAMILSVLTPQTALAYHQGETTQEVTELETKNAELAQWVAAQGMVLLENRSVGEAKSLPLEKNSNIALFGAGSVYTMGRGSRRGTDTIYEGLMDAGFHITTYDESDSSRDYLKHYMDAEDGYVSGKTGIEHEITEEQLEAGKADGSCSTAVYIISRTSGEGADGTATQGDYYLLPVEYNNLCKLAEKFENVVVVMNVESPVDTNFFHGKAGTQEEIVRADLEASTRFEADEFAAYRDSENGLYREDEKEGYVKIGSEEAYNPEITYYQYFDKYGWGINYYEQAFVGIQKAYYIKNEDGSFSSVEATAVFDPNTDYYTKNVENKIEGLDSMLFMSHAGKRGGHALAQVLSGEITPSGKLADTWTVNYEDYPSSATFARHDKNSVEEDYSDDIYVGYRYFDTFGVDVAYPFGYGLSYTDFAFSDITVEADSETVTASVTVTNTGDTAGKEVVEIYYSAPDVSEEDILSCDLENPYQELAAFAKTDELQLGESQTLTIAYNTDEMASYSEKNAAYVLQKGDYIIRVGNSSRNTSIAAVISMDNSAVTKQLTNRMVIDEEIDVLQREDSENVIDNNDEEELKTAKTIELNAEDIETVVADYSDGKYFDSTVGETVSAGIAEVPVYVTDGVTETQYLRGENGTEGEINYYYQTDITPAVGVNEEGVMMAGENNPDDDILIQYNEKIVDMSSENATAESTLKDVADGKISMEAFVSTLTLDELSNIVMGRSVGADTSNEYSVAGEAGETTAIYMDSRYITPVSMSDGPEGIGLQEDATSVSGTENYQYCTYWPCETLQASTWDLDAIGMIGDAVGEEMERYGLALWLAPGINIHRNPLCGRNPQYYSEDPVIAGNFCAAVTKNVQSHPGCGVTLKHMAANNQETDRVSVNNSVSERALREIYLKSFERTILQAQPMSIMTSYNSINGWAAADNYDMCTSMVRDEWGFKGLIMTDWNGGESTPAFSMHAGNDLIMPGGAPYRISGTWGDGMYPTVDIRMVITDMNDYELADANTEGVVISSTRADTSRWDRHFRGSADLIDEGVHAYLDGCLPGSDERVPLETLMEEGIVWKDETDGQYVAKYGSTVYMNLYIVQGDLSKSRTYGNLSLGDVQNCVMNILNLTMNTQAFTEYMNKVSGTTDYVCQSWNETYADSIETLLNVSKSDIK